ncbi:MAG: SDR family NAD(P)-dependent oxidoreductase [Pseudomonadota bacterium]
MDELRFDGQVAVVTGAGNGLGRSHALLLASRGARVVVNDLGGDIHGDGSRSSAAADAVVQEIRQLGGDAVANYDSVEEGEKIVQTATDAFGRVDILVNNAGILRDTSFAKMSGKDWELILSVHLNGAYRVTRAAWPIMREQGYGRVIMTTSAAGLYGNFGQANYSAAKLGSLGLANTLAIEGAKSNIHVNTIAPIAGSRLTETVLPQNFLDALKPEGVSALVGWLCHADCSDTGEVYEVGAGYVGKLRWQRTVGGMFNPHREMTPERIAMRWKKVSDFATVDYPTQATDVFTLVLDNAENPALGGNEFLDLDAAAEDEVVSDYEYQERDLALYALGIGAGSDPADRQDLQYLYELGEGFMAQPSYAAMPALTNYLNNARDGRGLKGFNFGLDRLLHGEQYTELLAPLPTHGKLRNVFTFKEAFDKDPHAVAVMKVDTFDEHGRKIAYNEISSFVRGAGGWGGERGPGDELNQPPDREPDAIVAEQTAVNQTLLYRLSGDWNPLHADPEFAQAFGFDKPILHGMCTFGYVARHVIGRFADNDGRYFKSIKVRFAKSVYPGDALETRMWRESPTRIVFQTRVVERDEICISNAAIELYPEPLQHSEPIPASVATAAVAATATAEPTPEDILALLAGFIADHPEKAAEVGHVYQWRIRHPDCRFVMDLKNGQGSCVAGEAEAECTFELDFAELMAMIRGEASPQKLYLGGKLGVDGDIMAAQKVEFLASIEQDEVQRRLAAVMQGAGDTLDAPETPAPDATAPDATAPDATAPARIDALLFQNLADRLRTDPAAATSLAGTRLAFLVDDQHWGLDLSGDTAEITGLPMADPDTLFTITDTDLTALAREEAAIQTLYQHGKLRVDGNVEHAKQLTLLYGLLD